MRGGLYKKGIALIAAIMLVVFASTAVLGVTVFIIERLHRSQIYRVLGKAVYLAQAGVHNAVYWFRFRDISANGYFSLGQANVDAQNFFVLGADASGLLMVNTSTAALGGTNNRDLLNLRIQNATNSNTIRIDRMIVTWNNARRLTTIRINGSNVWTGNNLSPVNANITNFTLNTTPTIYNINFLRFNGSMVGSTISIQFIMSDATSKTLTVFPASNNYNFTVKSTGKTTLSNIYKTIQADYNAITAKLTAYDEIAAQITP